MGTARQLILENTLGQKVRTFRADVEEFVLIYRLDTRRVEAHANLVALDEAEVSYQILNTVTVSSLKNKALDLKGLGRLRLLDNEDVALSPTYELEAEEDSQQLQGLLKKTAAGHLIVVGLLIVLSAILAHFAQTKEDSGLVTIALPKPEVVKTVQPVQKTPVAQKKVIPKVQKKLAVQKPTIVKPVAKVVAQKTVVQHKVAAVVAKERPRDLSNMGALAALGGTKNGTRGYQGLDSNSLKNIRSAGAGVGGGGVGDAGAGGTQGVLPGQGLIAGSAGRGGKAESAGGYGTRGVGGGRAGYGKIALVGGTGGFDLPSDEEVVAGSGLDRDQIAAVINRNKGQIIYCYEQGLQGQSSLSGRVDTDFIINAEGRISISKVDHTSLHSQLVESCILAKMKTWQFPHPVGGVDVNVKYPFELRRVSSNN